MSLSAAHPHAPAQNGRALPRAGYLLGFALGGFFDGILLHQVLQWHHLLSGVNSATLQDLRTQILADGLFHAAMYVIAATGLLLLWRSRRAFAAPRADRLLFADALIGFGAWHIVDAVLSHWVLGIHRIRMDSDNRLAWDLLWFFVFGVGLVVAGWWLRRRAAGGSSSRGVAPLLLAILVLIAGPIAALPPQTGGMTLVVFRPEIAERDVFAAVAAVDGRIVWGQRDVWMFEIAGRASVLQLYGHGALLVGGAMLPAACASWSRAVMRGVRPAAWSQRSRREAQSLRRRASRFRP